MNLFSLLAFIWTHPLNRSSRFRAISRFVRWQIASRIIRQKIALPFVNDTVLLVKNGMTGATGNYYCGLNEQDDMGFVLHALKPGEMFIDVGANIGSYSVLAGAVGATVIAIEPISATYEHLRKNIELNGFSKSVDARCLGVSDRSGVLQFSSNLDTMNHVLSASETAVTHVEVPVTTLDSICEGLAPAIIKIDVEGHELAVLLGGVKTLTSLTTVAVILEINGNSERYGVASQVLLDAMSQFGFISVGYDPICRTLKESAVGSGNTIFIRNREQIIGRVNKAPTYKLVNGCI